MNHATFSPLGRALAASLILHASLFAFGARLAALLPPLARPSAAPLKVRLAEPLPVPVTQPALLMAQDTAPAAAPAAPRVAEPAARRLTRPPEQTRRADAPAGVQVLSGVAARKAAEQITRELFYPLEAIDRGLEGEVLVLLFLDASGNAVAARIEASSGHAILDEAAVRAARTLRSLPASAPREALVPVRFRLH